MRKLTLLLIILISILSSCTIFDDISSIEIVDLSNNVITETSIFAYTDLYLSANVIDKNNNKIDNERIKTKIVLNKKQIKDSYVAYITSDLVFFANESGDYSVTFSLTNSSRTTSIIIHVGYEDSFYPKNQKTIGRLNVEKDKISPLPSTGDVKCLVVPVEFTNQPFDESSINNLESIFNGNSNDYESVSSFYRKSSYDNLNLIFDISPIYYTNKTSFYYKEKYDELLDYQLIKEFLTKFNKTIDFSEYDINDDGYIDSIYLIYSSNYDSGDSVYWAYSYVYHNNDIKVDRVKPFYYCFASIDFIYIKDNLDKVVNLSASTYIHETGHLLGLIDYYDTDESIIEDSYTGGFSIMDENYGDFDPFSKLILGWLTPLVVLSHSLQNYNLYSLQNNSNDSCILIPYNYKGDYFSEFILISYYTDWGLDINYNKRLSRGIIIFQVTSTLSTESGPWNRFKYDNSNNKIPLVKIIEADNNSSIYETKRISQSDIFSMLKVYNVIIDSYVSKKNISFSLQINNFNEINNYVSIDVKF